MKIGIIGTGMLGNAVGQHLLESGYDLTVFNRTNEKTGHLKEKGAKVAKTPKEVAERSDFVIIIVKDAKAVNDVSFEKDGIVFGKHGSLAVADMSTIGPVESKGISQQFEKNGIKKIDIPVMGGPNVAVSGNLVVMASGDRQTFRDFKEVLETIGNKVFFLGEHGVAHAIKLLNPVT